MEQKKIAIVISSYKRPDNLIKQLYCIRQQTYQHFNVFASVKGVPQFIFETLAQNHFSEEINSGKFSIKFDPNKNQVSNFLDPIREVNLDDFDLFVKMDDDDFYGRDFLKWTNESHSKYRPDESSFMWGDSYAFYGGLKINTVNKCPVGGSGAALPPNVIRRLFKYESMPPEQRLQNIKELYPSFKVNNPKNLNDTFGFDEDTLLYYLAQIEKIHNRWHLLSASQRSRFFIPKRTGQSVTRGGTNYLSDEFKLLNSTVTTNPQNWEYSLCIKEKQSYKTLHIFNGNIFGDKYKSPIKTHHPKSLIEDSSYLYQHIEKDIYERI